MSLVDVFESLVSAKGFVDLSAHSIGSLGSLGSLGEDGKTYKRSQIRDAWLAEEAYNRSISTQQLALRVAYEGLDNVDKEVAIFEEIRVKKLRAILRQDYIQNLMELFEALKSIEINSLDEMMLGTNLNKDTIEDLINNRSLDRLKQSKSHRSSIMNRSVVNVSKNISSEVKPIETLFGSPMSSSRILLSNVVEAKKDAALGSFVIASTWKPAMAIVTNPATLHLFNLPEEVSGSEPEQKGGFDNLYPQINYDRQREIVSTFIPTTSLDLKMCKILISVHDENEIEIIEDAGKGTTNNGLISVAKNKLKSCNLRLGSSSDALQFVKALKMQKKAKASKSPIFATM